MKRYVQRVPKNTVGRDIIVGDIHGHFKKLAMALDGIGFSAERGDRLFSVGDMVDRGPESLSVLDFLKQPFVYAVGGNHEDMAWRWPNGYMCPDVYASNGGAWMLALDRETQLEVAHTLGALPVAIELETEHGLIGIVHADCPCLSWSEFTGHLEDRGISKNKRDALIDLAQWSRDRINRKDCTPVHGVRAVVVGHTPITEVLHLGNVIHIDTQGWRMREFTLLDAATLKPAERIAA